MGILKRLFTPPEGYTSRKNRLGVEWLQIAAKMDGKKAPRELHELLKRHQAIGNILVKRNLDGKAAEKAGRDDAAIDLYEQNVADGFDGHFPYDRLRVLYSKRKQYGQAIRVYQAYLDLLDELVKIKLSSTVHNEYRQRVVEEIAKLRKKLANSPQ